MPETATTTKLEFRQLTPYLSPYLQGGYKQDCLAINYVEVDPFGIRGSLEVEECFMPQTGQFHLTVPLAFIWVAQLGIIYGCIDNSLREKPGEIFLREIAITCKRPVTKMRDLIFDIKLIRRLRVPGGMFYRGRIDIEDKSFLGISSFVLPIPSHTGSRES